MHLRNTWKKAAAERFSKRLSVFFAFLLVFSSLPLGVSYADGGGLQESEALMELVEPAGPSLEQQAESMEPEAPAFSDEPQEESFQPEAVAAASEETDSEGDFEAEPATEQGDGEEDVPEPASDAPSAAVQARSVKMMSPRAAVAVPTLAPGDTWNKSETAKDTVYTINIVDSYAPTGAESESWDASSAQNGSVTAYVSADGRTLTIAGNGSGKIMANANSKALFGSTEWSDRWVHLGAINGIGLLDVSNVTDLSYLFANSQHMDNPEGIETWNTGNVQDMSYAFVYWLSSSFPDIAGWDTSSVKSMKCMFDVNNIASFDVDEWDVSNVQNMYAMFRAGDMTSIDLSTWDTSSLTNMGAMFTFCREMTTVNLSNFETGSVTDMAGVFNECIALETIVGLEDWDTSSCTDMQAMFVNCYALTSLDVSSFDTSNVANMSDMFRACKVLPSIQGIENFDTSSCEDMDGMFGSCYALTSLDIDHFDMSNVYEANGMFSYSSALRSVDVSKWDVSSLTHAREMFRNCAALETIDVSKWNTAKLWTAQYMFAGCASLTEIDISGWYMGKMTAGTSTPYMFADCTALESLVIPASLPNVQKCFAKNCTALTEVTFKHKAGDILTFPAAAGADTGAFYVASTLSTTVNADHQAVKDYAWATDNRTVTFKELPKPTLAAGSSWYKGVTDKSGIVTVNIVDSYKPSGSEKESWDASNTKNGSVMAYVSADGKTLTIAGNGSGFIMANRDSSYVFDAFSSLVAINGTKLLNTSNAVRMDCMFSDCEKLQSLNLDSWDVSNVYTFSLFAQNCYALTSFGPNNLRDWDTGAVEQFSNSFDNCQSLAALDVSNWDVSSCEVFNFMFSDCKSLKVLNVSAWNPSSAVKMACIFQRCESLTTLDFTNWNTPLLTDASGFLYGCTFTAIDVTGLDLGLCTDIAEFFYNCKSLKTIKGLNGWDTGSIKLAFDVFANCKSLTDLDLSNWVTPNMTNCGSMFSGCESLKVLDIGGLNTSASSVSNMFKNCYRLQQVTLGSGFTFNGKNSTRSVNLPTPDPAYIPLATGNWQAVGTGTVDDPKGAVYLPADVPSNVAETYVIEVQGDPILAAGSTWYKGATAKTAIVTISIVDSCAPAGSEKESWDASAEQDGSVMAYVSADGKTLTIAGNGSGYIMANANSSYAFEGFTAATSINGLRLLDTSETTNMESMFEFCELVTVIDVSGFDTGNVTNMNGMFKECDDLVTITGIEGMDTSKVKSIDEMFYYCRAITSLDLGEWDFSSLESMELTFTSLSEIETLELPTEVAPNLAYAHGAFRHCTVLTEIDVSFMRNGKLKDVSSLFEFDYALETIVGYENLVTSETEKIDAFFNYCRAMKYLDVSNWDTSNVSKFDLCFRGLSSIENLEGLENLDTSKATSMQNTFANSAYVSIDGIADWDVSKVTNFTTTFSGNWNLEHLDLSGWKTSSATNMKRMFYDCAKLETLDIAGFQTSSVSNITEMFAKLPCLRQITLGSGFAFAGNGSTSCVLPTPDPAYIEGATGKWRAVGTGTVSEPKGAVYLPAEVPSNVNETYVPETQGDPILAAGSTWYKGATAKTAIVTISIVDSYAPTGSEKESWDASEAQDGSVMAYVASDGKTLVLAGNGYGSVIANKDSSNAFQGFTKATAITNLDLLDVSGTTDMTRMFYQCESVTTLNVSGWDVSDVRDFDGLFGFCKALTSFGSNQLSNWDVSSGWDMSDMFYSCSSLESIDVGEWDVSSVWDMGGLFSGCGALAVLDVSDWDTSELSYAHSTFSGCAKLATLDVSGWDTSKVTNFTRMFNGCKSLTVLDVSNFETGAASQFGSMFMSCQKVLQLDVSGFDTSKATTLYAMFYECDALTSLDVSGFNTARVTDFSYFVRGCNNLTSLSLGDWNTSSATDMSYMFEDCYSLISLDVPFETLNVTDFTCMFSDCSAIRTLDLDSFSTAKAADMDGMFSGMNALRQITLGTGFSFSGNGTAFCVLPTPDPAYIEGAIGMWQAVGAGTVSKPAGAVYLPLDVPSNMAETYVMPNVVISVDVPVKVVLAADATGDWCTPTAEDNTLVNRSLLPVSVVSAEVSAANGFTLMAVDKLASSDRSNVFAGTIKAGSGVAQDLTSIDTSGAAWTMAAATSANDSDAISLQLAGSIANVEGKYFTSAQQLFTITYTFELVL